jgi:UDP-GlcNAc:undecaprenyl-phosphate GlcNAc-1-phosphate transferase
VILWTWTALLSGLVLYPTYTGRGDAVVPLGIAGLGLLLFTVFHPGARLARTNGNGKSSGGNGEPPGGDAPLAGVKTDH